MGNNLTPALSVTVEIRDGDIKHGQIAKCRSCPAALAANRATGCFCDTGGVHLIAYDNGQFIENSNLLAGLLPAEARVWIARFDEQRNGLVYHDPAPLDFPLDLYRVTDFTKRTYDPQVREMLADAAEVYLSVAQIIEVDPTPPSKASRAATSISSGGSDAIGTGPGRLSPTSTGRQLRPGPTS